MLDVGERKKTEKSSTFSTFTLSFHVYFSHMNHGTSIQLERCAMYHCAPGVRRLHTNSISIDRRWIRPRSCYFTFPPAPLPSPRPFIHDRQLDSDKKKKKKDAKRMEGLSPLSPGRMFCLAAVGGSQVARTCEEVGGGGSDGDPRTGVLGENLPRGTTAEWK